MSGPIGATDLEREFHEDMVRLYHVAAKKGYRATYFMQMVAEQGGVEAARALLGGKSAQAGLYKLAELKLLHASVENLALNPKYGELFLHFEKRAARERLAELGFTPGGWD